MGEAAVHVALDADDTLWHNEPFYSWTQEQVVELLAPHVEVDDLGTALLDVERRNLRLFGYGAKGFTLSLIETALDLGGDGIPAGVIRRIVELGKSMLEHPVELLPGVEETVLALAERYPLLLVTKGDLFHQESKIAQSGLSELFEGVEVVAEKNPETYRRILRRYAIEPDRFVMVGNSVRSDVLPVLAIGGHAVHVPYAITWEHEAVPHRGAAEEGFWVIESIRELPTVLEEIGGRGEGRS